MLISVDSKVVWFTSKRSGRQLTVSKGEGIVTELIGTPEPFAAKIRTSNGGHIRKHLKELRLASNDNPYSVIEHAAGLVLQP